MPTPDSSDAADRNWRRFVLFRVLFNSRFYYPVLAVLFLDLGLSATQYTLLNFGWAFAIVCTDLPAGALADRLGRRPLVDEDLERGRLLRAIDHAAPSGYWYWMITKDSTFDRPEVKLFRKWMLYELGDGVER